jgi:hypothetical protein
MAATIYHTSNIHIRDQARDAYFIVIDRICRVITPGSLFVITGDIFHNPSKYTSGDVDGFYCIVDKILEKAERLLIIPGACDRKGRSDLIAPLIRKYERITYLSAPGSFTFKNLTFDYGRVGGDVLLVYNSDTEACAKIKSHRVVMAGGARAYTKLSPSIAYPGAPYQHTPGDSMINGILRWDISAGAVESRFIPIQSDWGYLTLTWNNGIVDLPHFELPANLRKIIVNYYNGPINESDVKQTITRAVYPANVWTFNFKDKTIPLLECKLTESIREELAARVKGNDAILRLHDSRHIVMDSGGAWTLVEMSWSDLYCYAGDNFLSFERFGGHLAGITAENLWGKSSIIDIIVYTLFNHIIRGGSRENIIRREADMGSATVIIQRGSVRYQINKVITRTSVGVNIYKDGVYINKGSVEQTYHFLESLIGTAAEFFSTGLVRQDSNNDDFIHKSYDVLNRVFELDHYRVIHTDVHNEATDLGKAAAVLLGLNIARWMDGSSIGVVKAKLAELIEKSVRIEREGNEALTRLKEIEVLRKSGTGQIEELRRELAGLTMTSDEPPPPDIKERLTYLVQELKQNKYSPDEIRAAVARRGNGLEECERLILEARARMDALRPVPAPQPVKMNEVYNHIRAYIFKDDCECCASNKTVSAGIYTAGKKMLVDAEAQRVKYEAYTREVEETKELLRQLNEERQIAIVANNARFLPLIEEWMRLKPIWDTMRRKEIESLLNDASVESEYSTVLTRLSAMSTEYKNIKQTIDTVREKVAQYELLKVYEAAIHPKTGIPGLIIQRNIGKLIGRANELLATAGIDFRLNFVVREELIELTLDNGTPLDMASGYQKFVISLAVRAGIYAYAKRAPSFLIVDEGFSCADSKNISVDRFGALLQEMKRIFSFVMIITHVEDLQPLIEVPVAIERDVWSHINNTSYVSYSTPDIIPNKTITGVDGTDVARVRAGNIFDIIGDKKKCIICGDEIKGNNTTHVKSEKHIQNLNKILAREN